MVLRIDSTVAVSDIRPSDRDAYVTHLQVKEVSDRTLRIPFPYTLAHADEWIAMVASHAARCGETTTWAIRDGTKHLIGGVGFDDFVPGTSEVAELGYWLAKAYWNQGIMTRVVRSVCDFVTKRWDLNEIVADVLETNVASQRVLEKSGFVLRERRPKSISKHGVLLDSRVYTRKNY